jgi:hypothetical protein
VRIVDPRDVQPTVNPALPDHVSGRQVHRRILSVLSGGPRSIDVGYNTFKAGIRITQPYAYDRDEFCYIPQGEMALLNCDGCVTAAAGSFVHRPARAATHRVELLRDTISICSFSPARVDGWSHRLQPDQIGGRDGEGDCPDVRIVPAEQGARVASPWADVAGHIEYSEMAMTQDFTLARATFEAGTCFARPRADRDEVWFVESGALTIGSSEDRQPVGAGKFVIWSHEDPASDLHAATAAVVAIFSAKSA